MSMTVRDVLRVHKASTLRLQVAFGISLVGLTVSVVDSNRPELENPLITVLDEEEGTLRFDWTDEQIATLKLGIDNRFRLQLDYPDGSSFKSNRIWVRVT